MHYVEALESSVQELVQVTLAGVMLLLSQPRTVAP